MREVTDAEPRAPIKGPGAEEGIKEPPAPAGTHFTTQSGPVERIPQKPKERADPAVMKVLILAVLLAGVCFLEGAVVKQKAEEPTPSEAPTPSNIGDTLRQALASLNLKGMLDQENVNGFRTQAQEHLQTLRERFSSVAEQFTEQGRQLLETLHNMYLSSQRN